MRFGALFAASSRLNAVLGCSGDAVFSSIVHRGHGVARLLGRTVHHRVAGYRAPLGVRVLEPGSG